jgi:DNA gyrase subunit A
MARKKQPLLNPSALPPDIVKPVAYDVILDQSMTPYAVKVLRARALPDIRDGLKPSIRRILLAMNDLGLSPGGETKKCAKIAGDTAGNLHPHGTSAVYQALVRLAQPWTLRYPLIHGQGNFGSPYGDDAAADRYTEAKLSRCGASMLEGLPATSHGGWVNTDIVPKVRNYDGSREEVTLLPSVLPNLIVNGGSGIAVGWATNMPPHNLNEVVAVIKEYVRKGDLTVEEIVSLMPGPDFPTGGRLLGQEGVRSYYATGNGKLTLEGSYELEVDDKGRPCIIVTGFPYGGNAKRFCSQMVELIDAKKLAVADMVDLTAKEVKIVVSAPKGGNIQVLLNQILKMTCLRSNFSVNNTVVDGARIRTNVSMIELVKAFVQHRRDVTAKALQAELEKLTARMHLIDGLLSAQRQIDSVIAIVRQSSSKQEAALALVARSIVETEEQAKAVLSLELGQLTRLDQEALAKERAEKTSRKDWIEAHLGSEKRLLGLVVKEQEKLAAQMGDARRTEITHALGAITPEDLIPEEEIVILLTADGYVKRVPTSAFKVQHRGGKGVQGVKGRDTDEASDIFIASTHDHVLFFTNRGLMYRRKGHEIPEGQRSGKGKHLAHVLSLGEGERVVATLSLRSLDIDAFIVTATKGGLIKKTPVREYDSALRAVGLKAIKLRESDELAFVGITDGDHDLAVITAHGLAARYHETAVSVTGRDSQGVKAMNFQPKDYIAQVIAFEKELDPTILVVTSQGFGKRSKASSYRATNGRSTRGVKAIDYAKADRNGLIVSALTVDDDDTLFVLTSNGKLIRMPVSAFEPKGRVTMGVKAIRLDENDSVTSIAKARCHEEEESNV